jgi:hypothetical protein
MQPDDTLLRVFLLLERYDALHRVRVEPTSSGYHCTGNASTSLLAALRRIPGVTTGEQP